MATSTTVEDELKEKRADYKKRMERVREREENLKAERQKLQNSLVQYYKYIQDNEIKRMRASKKADAEAAATQDRFRTIVELSEQMESLEREKHKTREDYLKYSKYEKYLNDVLHYNDGDEYLDAREIIARYRTLDENRTVLQKRKTQLEHMLTESKRQLSVQEQRSKNESVELQNQVNEMQRQLENKQREYKKLQDELERSVALKSSTTKTIGQVRMACQNLYDRCQTVNAQYRGRAAAARQAKDEDMIIAQLQVIGDCIEDYQEIQREWRNRGRKAEGAVAGATTAGATTASAGPGSSVRR